MHALARDFSTAAVTQLRAAVLWRSAGRECCCHLGTDNMPRFQLRQQQSLPLSDSSTRLPSLYRAPASTQVHIRSSEINRGRLHRYAEKSDCKGMPQGVEVPSGYGHIQNWLHVFESSFMQSKIDRRTDVERYSFTFVGVHLRRFVSPLTLPMMYSSAITRASNV